MDSDQVNRWLTLGANIGVLVGILLLIVELNQNRDMMRAQTRHQVSQEVKSFLVDTAYNRQMAEVVVRVNSGTKLTPEDELQYRFRIMSWFRIQENVHYQARQGLFDDAEFIAFTDAWHGFVDRNPTIREIWCDIRGTYSPEFRTLMNDSFTELNCE